MSTNGSYTPAAVPECAYEPEMTRAAALALRTAGQLDPNCVVVITDADPIGTPGNTSSVLIELNPVSPTDLGTTARVHTTFATSAWSGNWDIDLGTNGQLTRLEDDWGNVVEDPDAGTTAVVSGFPWHLSGSTLRDNHIVDSTLTGWDAVAGHVVTDNVIRRATVNLTGWVTGSFTDSSIISAGTSVTSGNVMTIGSSRISGASTITGAATGQITIQSGSSIDASTIVNDAGSTKSISLTDTDARGVSIRGQGGTVAVGISFGASRIRSKPFTGDSLVSSGDCGLTITGSDVNFPNQWSITGAANRPVLIQDSTIDRLTPTRAAVAGRLTITNSVISSMLVDQQGTGDVNIQSTWVKSGTVSLTAPSTGSLTTTGSSIENGTITITSVRSLSTGVGAYIGGNAAVTQSGATATTLASQGDRIDQSRFEGGAQITFSTTTGSNLNTIARTNVRGSSVGGEGALTITGTSNGVFVDNCDVLGGIVTFTDVNTDYSGASAFTDNHVDGGSILSITGGDGTAKQVRNNRVEGLSTVTLTNMTGTAGAGLGDVFGMSVRGQSLLTVTGARVVGFPVRDCTVEQGSVLNVDASGTLQFCRVAGQATVNTGAFAHQATEVSLNSTTTFTAANIGRLRNKSFSDVI